MPVRRKKKRLFCGLTTADWRWSDELHIISNGNIQMTLSKLVRNVCLKLGLKPLLCPKQWSQCLCCNRLRKLLSDFSAVLVVATTTLQNYYFYVCETDSNASYYDNSFHRVYGHYSQALKTRSFLFVAITVTAVGKTHHCKSCLHRAHCKNQFINSWPQFFPFFSCGYCHPISASQKESTTDLNCPITQQNNCQQQSVNCFLVLCTSL